MDTGNVLGIEREAFSTHSMSGWVQCLFFGGVCRWFRWRLLDDLAGVDARAAHVRGWGANPLHPRGSGFGPPDGHGDRSLWVTHGQRQPAHLAIGDPPLRYGETSSRCHATETSGEMFLVWFASEMVQKSVPERRRCCCVTDTWQILTLWGTDPRISQMLVSRWRSPLSLWSVHILETILLPF